MKKQFVSLLLAFTIAFPTSVLAQQTSDQVEVEKGMRLVLLTSGLNTVNQFIFGGSTLAVGAVTYIFMGIMDRDPIDLHQHRAMHMVSDIELLSDANRFEQYVRIWDSAPETQFDADDLVHTIPVKGAKVKQLPVQIQHFEGVNRLMAEMQRADAMYDSTAAAYTFQSKTKSFAIPVRELQKVFHCIQFSTRPEAFFEYTEMHNLRNIISEFGLTIAEKTVNLVDPTAFQHADQFAALKVQLTKQFPANKRAFYNANPAVVYNNLINMEFKTLNRQTPSRFLAAHNSVILSRKGAKIVPKAIFALAVTAIVGAYFYALLEEASQVTSENAFQKYNISPQDAFAIMQDDPEFYRPILEQEPQLRKKMAETYDTLVSEARRNTRIKKEFDDYVRINNI